MLFSAKLPERFWEKVSVEPNTGCWLWVGASDSRGYGSIRMDGKSTYTHRLAWQRLRGPIPAGLVIDHRCETAQCCNPDHVEPVSFEENIRRGTEAGRLRVQMNRKTHCKRGHEFTEENTFIQGSNRRQCRICARARNRAEVIRRAERNAA